MYLIYNNSSQAIANYLLMSPAQRYLNYFRCASFSVSHWYLHFS